MSDIVHDNVVETRERNLFEKKNSELDLPIAWDYEDSDDETLVQLETGEDIQEMITTFTPRRKRFIPKYDIEGVKRVIITEETQITIELCIGMHVTSQNPWKFVKKSLVIESMDYNAETSEFFTLKELILSFDQPEILMGYIPDDSRDYDEFYICLTRESTEHCRLQSERFLKRQAKKLEKAVFKKSQPWTSLGSEVEITELKPVNTRPLYEVIVTSRYLSAQQPDKFVVRDPKSVRDGYIELLPYRVKYNNVLKRRVDRASQAASERKHSEAQTELKYPQNVWTQSSVDDQNCVTSTVEIELDNNGKKSIVSNSVDANNEKEKMEKLMSKLNDPNYLKEVNDFIGKQTDQVESIVELNSVVDIYSNDYKKLITRHYSTIYNSMSFEEYVCFTDVRAKDKFVSCAAFHPMWSGVVAISYADVSPCILTTETVQQVSHGGHPVCIWSHIDSLLPKLFLDVEQEVKVLSFCPFNENILVGGCTNGQIVIWDIEKKLEKAEEIEVLTEEKERHRTAMSSQMGWMKNIQDKTIVKSTALSHLIYSHNHAVTAIKWSSPRQIVSNTGRKSCLDADQPSSSIFYTSASDGTILIWNLSIENVNYLDVKKSRRSKRVPILPAGLTLELSPLKILDRMLQPIYKINLSSPNAKEKLLVQSLAADELNLSYIPIKRNPGSGRQYFEPVILDDTGKLLNERIYVGTVLGKILKFKFEGHDFNTGEVVNSEFANYNYRLSFHDGPIVTYAQNPFLKHIFLSVGGKMFAMWHDDMEHRPLLWKKRKYRLTSATWSMYKASLFFISTSDGTLEIWDFLIRSDQPIYTQTVCGHEITGVYVHNLAISQNMIGIGDRNGSFRLFFQPAIFMLSNPTYSVRLYNVLDREFMVQRMFIQWQSKWAEKNSHIIEALLKKDRELVAKKAEDDRKKQKEADLIREVEIEAIRREKIRVIGPEERWERIINKLIEKTIAIKKRINRAELELAEQPLRDLERQRLEKEKKMLEIMKNQQIIFQETVGIVFPEAKPKAPKVRPEVLPSEEKSKKKSELLEEYDLIRTTATELVKSSPYRYSFEWRHTLADGKERRRALDPYSPYLMQHRRRIDDDQGIDQSISEPVITEIFCPMQLDNSSSDSQSFPGQESKE